MPRREAGHKTAREKLPRKSTHCIPLDQFAFRRAADSAAPRLLGVFPHHTVGKEPLGVGNSPVAQHL